jgi:alpha-aminoadipate carrier protein LysW
MNAQGTTSTIGDEGTISLVSCPECGAEINAPNDVMLKEILSCPDCGLELEVAKIEGQDLELKKILIEKEDWGE